MENNFNSFIENFARLKESGNDFVVVTMVETKGSAPQDSGSRMIVTNGKIAFGTIGGGKIEARCLEESRKLMSEESPVKNTFHKWNLQKDIGMTCGGEVSLFFEVFKSVSEWKIAIFGAGHVSIELNQVLARLNCQVKCFDHRSEWTSNIPNAICTEDLAAQVAKLDPQTFVVIMTMGHKTDMPILSTALKDRDFPYVGVIGSKAKRNVLERELAAAGINNGNFICPIGEKIGSNAPSEIAISICSQLLKGRDKLYNTPKRIN